MCIKYSVIIPCFNEGDSLPYLISEIREIIKTGDIEFILVNNGSSDRTEEILNEISDQNILKVKLENNIGYGNGIKSGLVIANGEYLGWTHADLQYSLKDSLSFIKNLDSSLKFIKGRRKGRTFLQKYITANMSIFESVLFWHILCDINAQPTVFHRDLLKNLVEMPNDFTIDLYTYVMAIKSGYKVFRFNVHFRKRSFGNSSWNDGIKAVFSMSIKVFRYSIYLKRKI